MSTIKSVVLVGAGGSVGAPTLTALLDAKFDVTVLTRPGSSSSFPSNVKVVRVDYNDAEGLAAALKGQDAVISTVGYAAILDQKKLIDAAVASGVKRFLPSEFGADPEKPARKLPVFSQKDEVEQYLKSRVKGSSMTYTQICNDHYFDWDLDQNWSVDIKAKTMEIFDGGDVPYTVTPLDFVAKGIIAVLQRPEETANRVIRLHGASMTQNKLLRMIQRYTGEEGWQISQISADEREKEAYKALQEEPENWVKWALAFLKVSIWSAKAGADFSKNNDNEMLGLKEMSEEEIEEVVRIRT